MAKSYKEKLLDPRWQKKRLEVMERDAWQCLGCGSKEKTLHVHHLRYTGEPWEAPLGDLETLCADCHVTRGEIDQQFRALSSTTVLSDLGDIIFASEVEMRSMRNFLYCIRDKTPFHHEPKEVEHWKGNR